MPTIYLPDGDDFVFFESAPSVKKDRRYGTESDDTVDVTDEVIEDECDEMFRARHTELAMVALDIEEEVNTAYFDRVTPTAGLLIYESDESLVDDDRAAEIDAAEAEFEAEGLFVL